MDISKLPKWAQEHIEHLEREREQAIRALNEFTDKQTESPFYYDDWVSTGETLGPTTKRVYIQTNKVNVVYKGVELEILLRESDDGIDIHWSDTEYRLNPVAFVPWSFQGARLYAMKKK